MLAADFAHHVRVAHRRRADDHAIRAGLQPGPRRVCAADAAAHLHRDVQRRHDGGDNFQVHRFSGGGAVQIHHVQPRPALLLPAERHGYRVV